MRSIKDLFKQSFVLSFEIFPPKSQQGDESLVEHLDQLVQWNPSFISCTYGAGGSTQSRTLELCRLIQERWKTPATAHFTCVGATKEELIAWLKQARQEGVTNIMALRGDPPAGEATFQAVLGGVNYANELVDLIREHQPEMGIGVAGYPEKHPEASDLQVDIENLKRKVDAGADAIFTQLFYQNDTFLRFRDLVEKAGIQIPIVPGLMPITEFARVKKIVSLSGTAIPQDLLTRLEAVQDDKQAQFEIGVEYSTKQAAQLMSEGVAGMHFYIMNRSEATNRLLSQVSLPIA